jgi:uncharacterized protein (DUF433 family)
MLQTELSMMIDPQHIPLSRDADDVIRVAGIRVTLDIVVESFIEGATAEEIVQQYPTLQLADVYAVLSYYLRHRSEIEEYLRTRSDLAAEVRRENESRFDPHGIRDRLMARRNP